MEKNTNSVSSAVKNAVSAQGTGETKLQSPEAYERKVNSLALSLTVFFGSIFLIPAKYIVRSLALDTVDFTGHVNFVHYFVNVHDVFVVIFSLILVAMAAKVCIDDKKDEFGLKFFFKIALAVAIISATISVIVGFADRFDHFETRYRAATALMEAEKYEEANDAFNSLHDYKDSYLHSSYCYDMIQHSKYTNAMNLIQAGEYVEAYRILEELDGYGNSRDMMESIYDEYSYQLLQRAEVGEIVCFGSYDQDSRYYGNYDNIYINSPIEWLVIAKQDGKSLLLSKHVLDCQPFGDSGECTSWETSSLRLWMNDTFFYQAFTAEEQAMIAEALLPADPNPKYGTEQGNATVDKVFALSIRELRDYFENNEGRIAYATAYAVNERNATNAYAKGSSWWTRTMGDSSEFAAHVWSNGGINELGDSLYTSNIGVRPAIWVELP